MNTMNENLRRCPFCDSKANLQSLGRYTNRKVKIYRAICSNVECEVFPATRYCESEEEAVRIWNGKVGEHHGR